MPVMMPSQLEDLDLKLCFDSTVLLNEMLFMAPTVLLVCLYQ